MKTLVFLALAVALCCGSSRSSSTRCLYRTRSDKIFWYNQKNSITCGNPIETLVQLNVPDGFDYVKPSVVWIKQCSGLFCSEYPMKCLASDKEKKIIPVQAFKRGNYNPTCVEVSVEEHTGCECGCDYNVTCEVTEVFHFESCGCVCDPILKRECDARANMGHKVQWSNRACACRCLHRRDCGGSMRWDPESCRCVSRQ